MSGDTPRSVAGIPITLSGFAPPDRVSFIPEGDVEPLRPVLPLISVTVEVKGLRGPFERLARTVQRAAHAINLAFPARKRRHMPPCPSPREEIQGFTLRVERARLRRMVTDRQRMYRRSRRHRTAPSRPTWVYMPNVAISGNPGALRGQARPL